MNFNYTIKYRTFDSLLEDVRVDLRGYALEGRIEPQQLIKVAMRISYDLGLRIMQPVDTILSIEHGKARLPFDFKVMNYAFICGEYSVREVLPQGTTIQEVSPLNQYSMTNPFVPVYKDPAEPAACSDPVVLPCNQTENTVTPSCLTPVCFNQCGGELRLEQLINTQVRTYTTMMPVRFTNSHSVDVDSPNKHFQAKNTAFIRDEFVWTPGLDCANFYMNYMGALTDNEGNILVPDHELLNEYYEYGLKQRIIENLILSGVKVDPNVVSLIEARYRAARVNALSFVNTPNFSEMLKLWTMNRKAMYGKYYNQFKSYGNWGGNMPTNNVV